MTEEITVDPVETTEVAVDPLITTKLAYVENLQKNLKGFRNRWLPYSIKWTLE